MEGSTPPYLFGRRTVDSYLSGIAGATERLAERVRGTQQPYSGADPAELRAMTDAVDLDTPLGDTAAALDEVGRLYLDNAVWYHEPGYVAHLNCPVAIPALSAEVLLAAVNSSVDTWDQSTAATLIEQRLVEWTAGRIGFDDADGVFTSGGTQSNLHGLLLARQRCLAGTEWSVTLPRLRILTSAESHFSVTKAANVLGLGEDAVVAVPTDGDGRMNPDSLAATMDELACAGLTVMAVVATAGTTDLGRIDPLPEIAGKCRAHGVWLHVDAAYGCGLLASRRRRHLLDGIEQADSVTADFHKSFFQPISSSVLVVANAAEMRRTTVHADYLNPAEAEVPNQVDKSLQTTRRFDALKLWMTLRTIGADQLGDMFDRVIDLADQAHELIAALPDFEVAPAGELSTVLFRYRPEWMHEHSCDRLMPMLRDRLFGRGEALVAGTKLDGHAWLKFTLLNPDTTLEHLSWVLERVRAAGEDVLAEEYVPEQRTPVAVEAL